MTDKFCTQCKSTKSIFDFNKNRSSSDGLQTYCRLCDRERNKFRCKNNISGTRDKAYDRKRKNLKINQNIIIEFLQKNPCIDCNNNDILVLEFDHRDPSTKYKNVGELLCYATSTVLKEIEKCDVRCANCHRIKTSKTRNDYRYQAFLYAIKTT